MEPRYQIVLSRGAKADIRRIYDYLSDQASLETAEYVKAGLEEEIGKLSSAPASRGMLRGHESKTVYRRVLKWSYRIIFSIEEQQLLVAVVRVDSSSIDPASLKDLP